MAKGAAVRAASAKPTSKAMKAKERTTLIKRGTPLQSLLQRGKCDREVVKGAAKMTKEQWVKHQEGMDVKWPLPGYMNGVKGGMDFKDETFAIVTRWTAETRIRYRPHAKRPGSKSHIRYERYSRAKTIGEALQLGTYPADWCWDFERGFLKVVGGFVRDEPLDVSKAEEGTLTPVDKAIHVWYKQALAKQLGVKVSELSEHQGSGESLPMRGLRLLAQRDAKDILETADREGRGITDEEVLRVLKRWAFARNTSRQNVMKEGQEFVFSDTLGLLRDRSGDIHLTAPTRRYPQVTELFARWLTDRLPREAKAFKFTSMNVNCNYAAALHRDAGNFGPSFIKAFGDFSGGQLNYWPEDAGGSLDRIPQSAKVGFDLRDSLALFNGNSAHSVEPFEGSRYSIVWFTLGCHAQMAAEDRAKLQQLGLPCPSPAEDPYALLRAPRGHSARKPTGAEGGGLPAWRAWLAGSLLGRGRAPKAQLTKSAAEAAKRRLAPENTRSFYGRRRTGAA